MRIAARVCECGEPDCSTRTLLAAPDGRDQWFAFALMSAGPGADVGELEEAAEAAVLDSERVAPELAFGAVACRALELYGLPFGEIAQAHVEAQIRLLVTSPPWFRRALLSFEPPELRGLRESVAGGDESVTRALRACWLYRELSVHGRDWEWLGG